MGLPIKKHVPLYYASKIPGLTFKSVCLSHSQIYIYFVLIIYGAMQSGGSEQYLMEKLKAK